MATSLRALLIAASAAVGCSSSGGGGLNGHPPLVLSNDGTTDMGGPPDLGPDNVCLALSTNKCISCCQGNHQTAAMGYSDSAFNCACVSPGACADACAITFCAQLGVPADKPCNDCLDAAWQMGGACLSVDQACFADPTCGPFLTCVYACP
jgi:hypothetical protein